MSDETVWQVIYFDSRVGSYPYEIRYNGATRVEVYCLGEIIDERNVDHPMSSDRFREWASEYRDEKWL